MAQRRMFSLQIVDTDAFLDMPQGSQLLYFHLALRGDDDGFVDKPKKIMRMIGANEDDMKILLAKRFILAFENGVVVIKHWRIHNLIRSDRYKETRYLKEKNSLILKKNGSYTESGKDDGIPNGNQMEPQVRLGKVRLGKDIAVSPTAKTAVSSKTMKNNSFYEEKIIDEEGNPLDEVEKKGRNEMALRLRRYYNKEAQRIRENKLEYGGTMGSYTMLCKLLKEYDEKQIKEMLDYYLYSAKFIEFPMLTSALSQDSVRRFFEKK